MEYTLERAPAKLNLTLDVLGRRPDGYHDMEMLMQTVDLADEVEIAITGRGIEVETDHQDLPRGTDNLAGRAAAEFFRCTGVRGVGVRVYIKKRIPAMAGMAGGSADAAALVRGLDRLLGTGLGTGELADICGRVGSDVPFCLMGGTALARGRGEVLTALPPMPECGIAVVKPGFSVSTPELFARLDTVGVASRPDTAGALAALWAGDLPGLGRAMSNVFEAALPAEHRGRVDEIKSALLSTGALGAAMTGTGSAVFGVFPGPVTDIPECLSGLGDVFMVRPVGKLI